MVIENQSTGASKYYWNFCSGNLAYDPGGETFNNSGTLNEPAFVDFAEDNGQYYAFITNHNNGTLTRNFYGDDFLSTPVSSNLGSFGGILPRHAQGIQLVQENNNWYAFIVGDQDEDSKLVRLDFGNSLMNTPTATNLGRLANMNYPVDLYLTEEWGTWIGFTVNKKTNELTRFEFSGGIDAVPITTNLGNPASFNSPCGILPIKENGNWYMFVSNYEGHEITRLDFGSSLMNMPSGSSIGDNSVLNYPFDLTIIRDCQRTYGFVLNRFNDIVRLEFDNGLDQQPTFVPLGNYGNVLYNPHGISDVFRVGDTLYTFVANIDNSTLARLYFPGCTNAHPASSTEETPPPITYDTPGLYNVNLVINNGENSDDYYCVDVVVLDSAEVNIGNDTIIQAGESIELRPDSTFLAYDWSTGSIDESIEVQQAGTYYLTVTNQHGCKATDDVEIIVDIGIPNFFTPNGDGANDTWHIPFLYTEPETEIWVYDRFGNNLTYYLAGDNEWDGTSNGKPLPTGTYWYVIKVPNTDKPYKGSVSIKR